MKITSLIENTAINPDLYKEHGLSLLIETGDKTILFDSGQSGNFVKNAEKLGIDLEKVDFAILSHGHYDHGNGMSEFLKKNKKAKIYVNKNAFKKYFHQDKYIGLNNKLENSDRLVLTNDNTEIDKEISLFTCNEMENLFPNNNTTLFIHDKDEIKLDDFRHEQYLKVIENNKSVLFSGCSHKDILNIMNWNKPDFLIGGFHLMEVKMDEEGKEKLNQIAAQLKKYDTHYYTCHCTGKKQYPYLKEQMGDSLDYLATGQTIII